MQLVTFALAAAVVMALAYTVLAERASYASVRRRQLDAWAALVALVCLLFLFSGGHDVRRSYERRLALAPPAPTLAVAIGRQAPVSLKTPLPDAVARPSGAVARAASDVAPAPEAVAVEAAPPPSDGGVRRGTDAGRTIDARPIVADAPDAAAQPALVAEGTGVPVDATVPARVPTPARQIRIGDPPPLVVPTLQPATPRPSMPQPPPSPTPTATATAVCGSPDDIDLSVAVREARADRTDGELVVRYRVEIGNEASFPVSLVNIHVTALNSAGGSETYGHASRPDMDVAAGAAVTIEGGLRLDRSPGPFGRTELCVTFSADSCGRRSRYEAFRRCTTVNGF